MLVLSRKQGESLMIGDGVVVTVLEVRGDVVRIGVSAPREVPVHREEVWRELQQANQEAASPSEDAVAALSALLPGAAPGRSTSVRHAGRTSHHAPAKPTATTSTTPPKPHPPR